MEPETPNATNVAEPIRRNLLVLAMHIFLVLFILDSLYAIALIVLASGYIPVDLTLSYATVLLILHTLKDILMTYLVLHIVIDWVSDIYYISEGHFVRQVGVLSIHEDVFALDTIEAVDLSQSWFGKIFNYGTVRITFMVGREKQQINLLQINDPNKFERLLAKYV